MFKDVLLSLSGVEIYPIISLVMFFLMFTAVVIWAFRIDKDRISKMESIPLEKDLNDGDKIDV